MKSLSWALRIVLCCHHVEMSRVFTIKKRTYQVCLDCGQEFEYSWSRMHCMGPSAMAYMPLIPVRPAEVRVRGSFTAPGPQS
jgi:hypothetical protein